jgi:hypothetical protein
MQIGSGEEENESNGGFGVRSSGADHGQALGTIIVVLAPSSFERLKFRVNATPAWPDV